MVWTCVRRLAVNGASSLRLGCCASALIVAGCDPSGAEGDFGNTTQAAKGSVYTISVSRLADSGAKSLRRAVNDGNRAGAKFTRIVIRLANGTYRLTRCGADDTNGAGDLDISTSRPFTIVGSRATVIQQTCPGERVIENRTQGPLTLQGVTITGGNVVGTANAPNSFGGGVSTGGDLELRRTTITGNSTSGAAGAVDSSSGSLLPGGDARGGGAYVGGALEAIDSTLASNSARAGAGASDTAGITSVGGAAEGGGAFVLGAITVSGGAISENQALAGGGASSSNSPSSGGAARGGGVAQDAVSTAAVSFVSVALTGNVALGGAAGDGGTTSNPSVTSGRADASGGAIAVAGPLSASHVMATQNRAAPGSSGACLWCSVATGRGGAIAAEGTVSLSDSAFTNNAIHRVAAMSCATVTSAPPLPPSCPDVPPAAYSQCPTSCTFGTLCPMLRQYCDSLAPCAPYWNYFFTCVLQGSCAGYQQISCSPVTTAARGGALWAGRDVQLSGGSYVRNDAESAVTAEGAVTAVNVQLMSNPLVAIVAGGDANLSRSKLAGNGSPDGVLQVGNRLDISESDLFDNRSGIVATSITAQALTIANSDGAASVGAAISAVTARLVNTTVAGATGNVSAVELELEHATITSTRMGGEPLLQVQSLTTNGSVVSAMAGPICGASVNVQGSSYDWFNDASCALSGLGDQQSAGDFLLGPIADNGGPVPTQLPAAGSVLIDRIPAAACLAPTDARGVVRPQRAGCDIGAVEVQ
ncbi:MAG TPA: choice-of-anchor Q domain-containing protein [Polyangiaceae bacterium]|nr:choice-of-anchor Q domain-containing protein [Polyangiaceae bacterium]